MDNVEKQRDVAQILLTKSLAERLRIISSLDPVQWTNGAVYAVMELFLCLVLVVHVILARMVSPAVTSLAAVIPVWQLVRRSGWRTWFKVGVWWCGSGGGGRDRRRGSRMGRADGTGTRNVRAELQLRFGGSVESASLGMARTDELRFLSAATKYGYHHIIDAGNLSR
ncbi:hypothetical protein BDP81DRAFT_454411 [Colletotrichum phormii]|uniref:Uncharacterized protein n=1 Tax=Colletotrichum phormii TaxID=359342 RepID=A0AAI9ZHF6_9PEZI|nr:uncharacterized protein BDP81DRAFT_454411 [Colletotrichum phormii]KAK1623620.1 hypothetical protein BDP81DRAFT_454411 [Colletotrichum phormii]